LPAFHLANQETWVAYSTEYNQRQVFLLHYNISPMFRLLIKSQKSTPNPSNPVSAIT
jgi:hypothetical protein